MAQGVVPLIRDEAVGWMTCDFTSFLTVLQSYLDDERLIMKDCVQWNPVYSREEFTLSGALTRDR